MKILVATLCLLIKTELGFIHGARILGFFTVPSISHQVVYRALMKELHIREHHLTVFTTDPIGDHGMENYTETDLSTAYRVWQDRFSNLTKRASVPFMMAELVKSGLDLCEVELNIPEVREFILHKNHNFDVMIVEAVLSPCFFAIGFILGIPMIGISSISPTIAVHNTIGNPAHPAYAPDILLGYTDRLNFLERIHSTVHYLMFQTAYHFWVLPAHDALVRKHFNEVSMPYIGDIINNISLFLVNSHSSFYYPRPNVPAMVEIAGLRHYVPKLLPKDLKTFLDEAPDGVIYFSLGSNVRSDAMSPDKRQMFLDAFSKLPKFRVLWKWESDSMPGQPSNVKVAKWLPQQDVLNHPKIKVFIYQGGLQSTEEALRVNVPVIGIPFYADQDLNVGKIVQVGAGIKVDYTELSKEIILEALKEIIYNPSYKANMKLLSDRVNDQPDSPLERAVWWTEYVIRHKGARHLRSAVLDLAWYQYFLLDVIAFVIVMSIVAIWISKKLVLLVLTKLIRPEKMRTKSD